MFARGQNLPRHLSDYLLSQYMSQRDIELMQLGKLQKILAYSKKNIPYYEQAHRSINLDSIRCLEDLSVFPFITKKDIKERFREFISVRKIQRRTKKTTGGSTGQPVTLWKTNDSVTKELAATWRAYSWAGIQIGDRQARFWGIPFSSKDRFRAKLIDFVSNRRRYGAFQYDDKSLDQYHSEIMKFKPTYFYGYVSFLAEYANFIRRNNLSRDYTLKCIISTSELLTKYHRDLLESVFSTKVYNEYGCGEVGSIAHECNMGSMHVMSENLIVEIYDGERRCGPDEIGEVVITELNNYAMPLIRYRIGDYAYISSKECQCGRKLPVLGNIFGRAYDTVRNRAGKLFHGEFFMYIIEDAQKQGFCVQSFQVIQNDLDRFTIKVVPYNGYNREIEQIIVNRVKKDFDPDVSIEFKIVDEIAREPSGKMRLIVGMDTVDNNHRN